jgi:hypothetical protein
MALANRFTKSTFIIISVFAILLFFILKSNFMRISLSDSELEENNKSVGEISVSKVIDGAMEFSGKEIVKEHNEKPLEPNQAWRPMGDEASKAKIIDWFESRGVYGFHGPDEKNDYQNYDVETLKKLSDAGDIRAMHLLAEKADTIAESNGILYNAAIYGSTGALSRIALSIEVEFDIEHKTTEERKPYIIESLAYYEAAQIRGDWWGKIQGGESLLQRYPTDLSTDDKLNIQKRGQDIYDTLQQRRAQMDLGEFDNSVPDEVIKFYEEMLRPL